MRKVCIRKEMRRCQIGRRRAKHRFGNRTLREALREERKRRRRLIEKDTHFEVAAGQDDCMNGWMREQRQGGNQYLCIPCASSSRQSYEKGNTCACLWHGPGSKCLSDSQTSSHSSHSFFLFVPMRGAKLRSSVCYGYQKIQRFHDATKSLFWKFFFSILKNACSLIHWNIKRRKKKKTYFICSCRH